jgi:monoamine oxidase
MTIETEVVIVGGGAAGIAAARRLHDAGVPCLIVEARPRLGGRAWTMSHRDFALDLGCGWLHSAERNPWSAIAQRQGKTIDRTTPPWERPSREDRFPLDQQREFMHAQHDLDRRIDALTDRDADRPAADFLEPGCRWNPMLDAVSTYYSGVELARLSARDLALYREDNANWRVVEGYGATVEAAGHGLPAMLDCPVTRIDHGGKGIVVETAKGTIAADRAIVTLPTTLLARPGLFSPELPDKVEAATGLPLGLADKLFLSLEGAEEFDKDSRLYACTDRTDVGAYHLRPFGRPLIECYFGGEHARELERGGDAAFFESAKAELTGVFGTAFAKRIAPVTVHRWGADPFAGGSYSYAQPGKAGNRALLATPVGDRLFFAGEATSLRDFSTAHGAFATGVAAAEAALAARL